jgi:hypothetical protein
VVVTDITLALVEAVEVTTVVAVVLQNHQVL